MRPHFLRTYGTSAPSSVKKAGPPEMHLGDTIQDRRRVPIFNNRPTKRMLIIGEPATRMLRRLAEDDIRAGKGCAFFGDTSTILKNIPPSRIKDTILFELDRDRPRFFNPFLHGDTDSIAEAFGVDESTPQLALYVTLLVLVMLSVRGNLYLARHLFTSKSYRTQVMKQLDPDLTDSLRKLYDDLDNREQRSAVQSLFNRLFQLTADPLYRNILASGKSLNLKENTILLVELPQSPKAKLLAALLMACLKGRVYVEYPLVFAGGGQAIIACGHLGQLQAKLQADMIGTATLCCFRLGAKDARTLEGVFDLPNQDKDLTQIPIGQFAVQLAQAHVLYTPKRRFKRGQRVAEKIKNRSRTWPISGKREHIEERIADFISHT